ncbi:MAG: hypothetical protein ACD_39C00095G0013 [uncultured bacterium]|nr:MAG: hypothetical protein ACD_39C00095G0013 [uncultured bacterium]
MLRLPPKLHHWPAQPKKAATPGLQSNWKKSLRRNNMNDKDFNRLIEGVKQFVQIRCNEIRAARKAVRYADTASFRTKNNLGCRLGKTSVA